MIWHRWVREYLPQNNVRSQLNKSQTKIEVADMVWLIEDNVKRSQYRMARIVEKYPGKDGVVRSALIKTLEGTLKRPLVKLAPLFNERFPSAKRGRHCWRLKFLSCIVKTTQVQLERFHADRTK